MMTDRSLDDLLRKSARLEPGGAFEDQVWRRIRAGEAMTRAPQWLLWPLPLRTLWASAVAVAASIILGVGMALMVPAAHQGQDGVSAMIHTGTLADTYLAMSAGGTHD